MHKALVLAAALTALALAGCADQSATDDVTEPVKPAVVAPEQPFQTTGTCPCEPLGLDVQIPEGWSNSDTWLEVEVRWDGTKVSGIEPSFEPFAEEVEGVAIVETTGPDGSGGGNFSQQPPQASEVAMATAEAERGFDSYRIQEWNPEAGARTIYFEGSGDFQLTARLLEKGGERMAGLERRADMVTLVPTDVDFDSCDPVEVAEQGARECLRLSNAVGNIGEGPLEVHLAFERGALAVAGQGRFSQRIYDTDGGYIDHDVGPASFHVAHSHWHYSGLAEFSLHAYDPATGLRGEEVSAHHKAGFCFLDIGQMEDDEVEPAQTEFAETNCLIPGANGWSMGISVGWYDLYTSGLTDQYVETSGVADGIYELVSLADGLGTLDEVDETNNAASVIVEINGNNVDVLEERGYYKLS